MHSYEEVHHAIQPAFRDHTPYMVLLLVDLDTQKGQPLEHEALRVVGNLTTVAMASFGTAGRGGDGRHRLARADGVRRCCGWPGAAVQWTLDEDAVQPAKPWRYPQE